MPVSVVAVEPGIEPVAGRIGAEISGVDAGGASDEAIAFVGEAPLSTLPCGTTAPPTVVPSESPSAAASPSVSTAAPPSRSKATPAPTAPEWA
jgi:hypothetical protein